MADPQIRALARRLNALEKARLASKQPGLSFSSIDGGALSANDDDGNLTLIIGQQHDGSNTAAVITGPPPPTPMLPLVTAQPGGLRIYWDGTWVDAVAPMDFARVLIYAVKMSVYTGPEPLNQAIVVGQVSSALGGEITVGLDPEEYAVYLVAWSQAGKFSEASGVALGTPSAIVDQAAIDAVQDAADAANAAATQAAADASTAAQQAAAADSKATQAASDAAAADSKATQAASDALAAVGIADGKGLVLIQSAAPTADQQTATTLWIDTTGGANLAKRWDGDSWEPVQDAAIQGAASDAAQAASDAAAASSAAAQAASDAAAAKSIAEVAAQAAADAHNAADAAGALAAAKSAVYSQETAPWPDGDAGHADDVGDMWINTSPGPGELMNVATVAVASGVATVRTGVEHGLTAGHLIELTGAMVLPDGTPLPADWYSAWTVASAPTPDTVTFALALADMPETVVVGGVAQGLDVKPLNRPHIWDGLTWIVVQDSGAEAAQSLQTEVKANQISLATLAVTATDAYHTAITADGRVVISDYEPDADDVEGKQDGSLWITRTRDRTNECPNPSFETSTAFWATTQATMTRIGTDPAVEGAYAAQVANSATLAEHVARLTDALPVQEGEEIIISGYMKAVTVDIPGAYATIEFWSDTTLLGAHVSQTLVTIGASDWVRAYAAAQAPPGTTRAFFSFATPAASSSVSWLLDGVLVERSTRLGRYFDGESDGGSWTGADYTSPSLLDGGAIIRLFNLEDGSWAEKFWTADTISSVDVKTLRSNKNYVRPDALKDSDQMDGALLADHTVAVDKLYAPRVTCAEAIPAGSLVNITNVGGVHSIRLAKAASGYTAHGFVLETGAIGDQISVYSTGYNPLLSGLLPGKQFLSTTPGVTSPTPPTAAGALVQPVGYSSSTTTLNFTAGPAVVIG